LRAPRSAAALRARSITGYRHVTRNGENTLSVATSAVNPTAGKYVDSKTFSEEVQAIYSVQRFNITRRDLLPRKAAGSG